MSTVITKIAKAVVLLNLCCISAVYAGVGSFYKEEDKYRGFYWFETVSRQEGAKVGKTDSKFRDPSPEEAANAIEARKQALDNARSQMVELGFREDVPAHILRQAIVKYKKLEAKMHDGAIRLAQASDMANFTNPEIPNVTEFPTNVFANKIKRGVDEQQKIATIREFANKFDLLLFTDDKCPYCNAFAPVIANFAKDHAFNLDSATLNSREGKIAQGLGITAVPTLVAVRKDGKELFEISRGLSSISELESSIVLANNYSEEQSQKHNSNKNNIQRNR